MGKNLAQKLIGSHLVHGKMVPGEEIGIKIDQTLTQDATGTMMCIVSGKFMSRTFYSNIVSLSISTVELHYNS